MNKSTMTVAEAGRLGGIVKSAAKTKAVRLNAKRPRPRKAQRSDAAWRRLGF